jgi:hypothetical protein
VTSFIKDHPGCVHGGDERHHYDAFRHFVIEFREQHADVRLDLFADGWEVGPRWWEPAPRCWEVGPRWWEPAPRCCEPAPRKRGSS